MFIQPSNRWSAASALVWPGHRSVRSGWSLTSWIGSHGLPAPTPASVGVGGRRAASNARERPREGRPSGSARPWLRWTRARRTTSAGGWGASLPFPIFCRGALRAPVFVGRRFIVEAFACERSAGARSAPLREFVGRRRYRWAPARPRSPPPKASGRRRTSGSPPKGFGPQAGRRVGCFRKIIGSPRPASSGRTMRAFLPGGSVVRPGPHWRPPAGEPLRWAWGPSSRFRRGAGRSLIHPTGRARKLTLPASLCFAGRSESPFRRAASDWGRLLRWTPARRTSPPPKGFGPQADFGRRVGCIRRKRRRLGVFASLRFASDLTATPPRWTPARRTSPPPKASGRRRTSAGGWGRSADWPAPPILC